MASIAARIKPGERLGEGVGASHWPVLGALAVLVLLMRAAQFGDPVAEMDDQLYSFIGWRMLSGELPYVDWWDRKPFGLFALFGLVHWIGGPGPLGYQLAAAFATWCGAALTYAMARQLGTRVGASLAAAFYIVLMSDYAGSSAQSEAFHVPLMLVMAHLVYDTAHPHAVRRALLAMAVGGLALQIKYTVLPQCLLFGLWALWGQYRQGAPVARILQLALGFAVLGVAPTGLIGLYYWSVGGWEAFYFANFESFFLREGAFPTRFYPRLRIWLLPLVALALAGFITAMFVEGPRNVRRYGFCGLWLGAALVTAFMPRTIYPFYLAALAPSVALIGTPFLDRRSGLGLALPLLGLFAMIQLGDLPNKFVRSAQERADIDLFAAAIAPHVDNRDACLLVFDGPTVLYRLTGGCAPSRIVYPDHLNNALETPAIGVSQTGELARILNTHPAVIVTATTPVIRQNMQNHALMRAALDDDYAMFASMELQGRTINAWRRPKR